MNEKVYGKNDLIKSRNIGIAALIIYLAAVALLILGEWRWSIVTFMPAFASFFMSLAFREDDQEDKSSWLFVISIIFGGAFSIALLAQLIYLITRG